MTGLDGGTGEDVGGVLETYVTAAIAAHASDTTDVHGIGDSASLVVSTDPRMSDARPLLGTLPAEQLPTGSNISWSLGNSVRQLSLTGRLAVSGTNNSFNGNLRWGGGSPILSSDDVAQVGVSNTWNAQQFVNGGVEVRINDLIVNGEASSNGGTPLCGLWLNDGAALTVDDGVNPTITLGRTGPTTLGVAGGDLDATLLSGQSSAYHLDRANHTGSVPLASIPGGTAGRVLRDDGVTAAWSALKIPASLAAGALLYGSAADTASGLAIGAANRVLTSSGSAPQWSDSLSLAGSLSVASTILMAGSGTRRLSLTPGGTATRSLDIEAFSNTAGSYASIAYHGNAAGSAPAIGRMHFHGTGQWGFGTSFLGAAPSGALVVRNSVGLYGLNAAGSAVLPLITSDASDRTVLGCNSLPLVLSNAATSLTVGAAGAAAATPAAPALYERVLVGGVEYKRPLYAA